MDLPRKSIAACWSAALLLAAPAAIASTVPVTNCNDKDAGSLRHAVNNANSGNTIDMTGLPSQSMLHTSPAIDHGNNTAALTDDQRGSGFPRVFGSAADIGADEWQGGTDDRIFVSGFELACDR